MLNLKCIAHHLDVILSIVSRNCHMYRYVKCVSYINVSCVSGWRDVAEEETRGVARGQQRVNLLIQRWNELLQASNGAAKVSRRRGHTQVQRGGREGRRLVQRKGLLYTLWIIRCCILFEIFVRKKYLCERNICTKDYYLS